MGKGKKARKQEDDWENDLQDIAKETGITLGGDAEEDLDLPVTRKKEKKSKKKKDLVDEEDSDEGNKKTVNHSKGSMGKPSFSALMMEDEGSGDDPMSDQSEEEVKATPKPKERKKEEAARDGKEDDLEEKVETTDKKKGKGKKKDKKKEDEDIDALLADLELSEKKEPEGKKGKRKGKKKEAELAMETDIPQTEEPVNGVNEHKVSDEDEAKVVPKSKPPGKAKELEDEDNEEGPKMKTAAQKKAEKKERERQKKEAQKAAQKKAKDKEEVGAKKEAEVPTAEVSLAKDNAAKTDTASVETTGQEAEKEDGNLKEDRAESGESDGEGESKDKKKKKKKKKKGEEEKTKTKKVGAGAVKKMQELLKMKKEEEERLKQEEEARLKALEEAENRRLEKLRLEQERKERKKQKEKERKERMKKEGKLLTPQQREAKRRAEMMLMAMKEKGLEVPSKDVPVEKKKVQYVTKRQKSKTSRSQSVEKEEETETPEPAEPEPETPPVIAEVEVEKKEEENEEPEDDAPESWDQLELDGLKERSDAEIGDDQEPQAPKSKEEEKVKPEQVKRAITEPQAAQEESSEEEEDEEEEEDKESSSEEEDEEDESSEEESESESEDEKLTPEKIKERARERIQKRRELAEVNRTTDKLRCPVICVLGHVDTGKTKILDKIRHTHVQDGEAGGITQQIGATLVPVDAIREQTKMIKDFAKFDLRLPGLLIIDTPGHESFSNLRTRGSSLCDMAILVVDIMHGLEPQTIESINLLRKKHTPFVVALNKIDRLFEWKRGASSQVEDTIKKQKKNTKLEFEERMQHIIAEFAEQGLNAAPFYKNMDEKVYISLVPTSAHSGDGMGDLMSLICKLTQSRLAKKLAFSEELQSTVMEVKALPGLGTTIDVILVNGRLKEGDTIVTGGLEGPIVTQIRALLTPQPLRELRVKSQYIQHKELEAAQGVKVTGKDLEKVMAGAPLYVAEKEDEIEVYKDEVNQVVSETLKAIKVSDRGVYVQASTLGSLEALLEFLKTSKIPYAGVNIGPVHKKDVMRASVMLEHEKMFAVILAFDVKVEREAQEFADKEGVKIFTADIIYHLFDKFTAYTEEYKQKKREEFKNIAVFPSKLRIMPQHIFNTRDPIVIGVHIEGGSVRIGTPLTVPSKEFTEIGFVTGIEANHKQMEKAVAGQEVCIKIEPVAGDAPKMYGRHFTSEDLLMSKITRESIDALKNYFREEMQKSDWQLIIEMKKIFGII